MSIGAERVGPDRILIPARAETPDGSMIGDGVIEIGPDHPDYAKWDAYIKRWDEALKNDPELRRELS